MNRERKKYLLEEAGKRILEAFDRESDEDTRRTPERFAKIFLEENGEEEEPRKILTSALFTNSNYNQMIVETGLTFMSICEHHLIPFSGKASIGYIPNTQLIGLSKLPRLLRTIANRPSVQEKITSQLADLIQQVVDSKGVGVLIKATHLCMSSRGIRAEQSVTITSAFRGLLEEDPYRTEFLKLGS